MHDILIACVGKPSAGKSSFLNAVTEAQAKIGNYPFTTIEPNHGVAFYPIECPCKRFEKSHLCRPRHGKCENGIRYVPVKMMDVAGLIPGASEGLGLGNKFLDDLRHADVLLHIVDVSGTTNEKGETTNGYDPINDIDWLRGEIHSWIYNNLKTKWSSIVRRHVATKNSEVDTMQQMLSGYGANRELIIKFLDKVTLGKSLPEWDPILDLPVVVDVFLEVRFPTVIALNKIDHPDSDKNITKIFRRYDESRLVLTSALSELFLKKMHKSQYINYHEGTDRFETLEDLSEEDQARLQLKPLDDKSKKRLEKIQDLVLFRHGGTGVQDAIKRAVDVVGMIPVFPVKNINTFASDSGSRNNGVFRDCGLVRPGTTVGNLAHMLDLGKFYLGAETVGSIQLGESDPITLQNSIISFKLSKLEES